MKESDIEYIDNTLAKSNFSLAMCLNLLYNKRKLILIATTLFFIIGVIVAILTPKEYTAEAMILPQVSGGSALNKKYNIASLIGFNLGRPEGNNISPSIYPKVTESVFFQKELLNSKIQTRSSETLKTYSDYLDSYTEGSVLKTIKKYTIGLPGLILTKLTGLPEEKLKVRIIDTSLQKLTKIDNNKVDLIKSQIMVSFNDDEGYLDIIGIANDPIAVASIVQNVQVILQDRIIKYNIQKSKDQLKFIEERFTIVKEDYISKRAALGSYRDRNQYSITSITKNVEEQLKEEYNLAYNIYTELASQRESIKLQIKKDTPIFSIIKPVVIPNIPSAPNKSFIVIGIAILGFFLISFYILYKSMKPFLKELLKI
jgi:hypothetical protein